MVDNQLREKREIKIEMAYDQIQDFKKEPEAKVLWDGIAEGRFGLMCGVAKTGKTTFAENIAISLAVGRTEYFNQKMDGNPRRVLFINLEESWKIRNRRNLKQLNELSSDELELYKSNFITTPKEFPEFLNEEGDWQYLHDYIEASNPDVVFIDSLTHMFKGDIEKSTPCVNFFKLFKKYIACFEKTVVVIHHSVKGEKDPASQNNIAGSRVILQSFQFAYVFANTPGGEKYLCRVNNKEFPIDSTLAEVYSINTNGWISATGKKCNKYTLHKIPDMMDGRKDSTNKDLIYDFMLSVESQDSQHSTTNKSSKTFTTGELRKRFVESNTAVMSKDTFHKCLIKLESDKKIKKEKKGVYSLINEKGNDDGGEKGE